MGVGKGWRRVCMVMLLGGWCEFWIVLPGIVLLTVGCCAVATVSDPGVLGTDAAVDLVLNVDISVASLVLISELSLPEKISKTYFKVLNKYINF